MRSCAGKQDCHKFDMRRFLVIGLTSFGLIFLFVSFLDARRILVFEGWGMPFTVVYSLMASITTAEFFSCFRMHRGDFWRTASKDLRSFLFACFGFVFYFSSVTALICVFLNERWAISLIVLAGILNRIAFYFLGGVDIQRGSVGTNWQDGESGSHLQ